jgi:hypothetical protein
MCWSHGFFRSAKGSELCELKSGYILILSFLDTELLQKDQTLRCAKDDSVAWDGLLSDKLGTVIPDWQIENRTGHSPHSRLESLSAMAATVNGQRKSVK